MFKILYPNEKKWKRIFIFSEPPGLILEVLLILYALSLNANLETLRETKLMFLLRNQTNLPKVTLGRIEHVTSREAHSNVSIQQH